MSECSPPDAYGFVSFTLSGYLRDNNSNPVANRTVEVTQFTYGDGASSVSSPGWASAVTKSDGSFSLRQRGLLPTASYGAGARVEYQASFAGDSQYAGSSSGRVNQVC